MSKEWKLETKWILIIGICASVLSWLVLLEFKNYNWALSFEHSKLLWSLWIFISIFSLIAGIIYFIRLLIDKKTVGLKNRLALIFLSISFIGTYGIINVLKELDKYLLPTSGKTEFGYTIYPPLSASMEHLEQLNTFKNLVYIPNKLLILLVMLIILTSLINWKRIKTAPDK